MKRRILLLGILTAALFVAAAGAAAGKRSKPILPVIGETPLVSISTSSKKFIRAPSNVPLLTNKWWSGGIVEQWPAPLFPLPLKGIITRDGLTLSVPGVKVIDRAILHADRDPLRISSKTPATGASSVRSGDWDVTMRVRDFVGMQFDATFIQGSPFVFIRAEKNLRADHPPRSAARNFPCDATCGSAILIEAPQTRYLLVSLQRDGLKLKGNVTDILGDVTVVAVAPGSDPQEYLAAAVRPYSGTRADFAVTDREVKTTFAFPEETIIGLLPHHGASLLEIRGNDRGDIGTFVTVRGPIRLMKGKSFVTSLKRPEILASLPANPNMRNDQELKEMLRQDIAMTPAPGGDVYAAAKGMLKLAMLAEIANNLGANDLRAQALSNARAPLASSCKQGTPLKFAHDKKAGGIIAHPPAFGSETYNDHHFHYGYIIHAAAIVARLDHSFMRDHGDCIRLLIRDIASANRNDPQFPYLRVFDPYAGHSWAGGITFFGDGNNQESTSEAIHAWHSIAVLGKTIGDKAMADVGVWLTALETDGAKTYWLNAGGEKTLPAEFPHPMISILWGGKADYATFFDGSDGAVRGIQFFPVTTALLPLMNEDIARRIVSPIADIHSPNMWNFGLALAEAIIYPAEDIPPNPPLDPVYSKTYVTYWLKALRQ